LLSDLGFVAAVSFAGRLLFFFMVFIVLIVFVSRHHSVHSKVERFSTELTHLAAIHYTSVSKFVGALLFSASR
jgi:hypothetical protein